MGHDVAVRDHSQDPDLWRRTVSAWWLRGFLWLLVVLLVAGAALLGRQAPRFADDEATARDAGPIVADVSSMVCEARSGPRSGVDEICRVTLTAEASGTTVSTVVERSGRPDLDGTYGYQTTAIYRHPVTGEIWFDDEPPGTEAGGIGGAAILLAGIACGLFIILRGEMHLASPFIPATPGAVGLVALITAGCMVGAVFAPWMGWWALAPPLACSALVIVLMTRAPVALEVGIGRVVLHRRGGRQREIRLGADTLVEVRGGNDPVIVLRRGTDRLRFRSSSWAARGALLKELERCLSLSGAPVPNQLGIARLHVGGW